MRQVRSSILTAQEKSPYLPEISWSWVESIGQRGSLSSRSSTVAPVWLQAFHYPTHDLVHPVWVCVSLTIRNFHLSQKLQDHLHMLANVIPNLTFATGFTWSHVYFQTWGWDLCQLWKSKHSSSPAELPTQPNMPPKLPWWIHLEGFLRTWQPSFLCPAPSHHLQTWD